MSMAPVSGSVADCCMATYKQFNSLIGFFEFVLGMGVVLRTRSCYSNTTLQSAGCFQKELGIQQET